MFTVPTAAMRMQVRIVEGKLRRLVEVTRQSFECERMRPIVTAIDKAIDSAKHKDAETVLEMIVDEEVEWFPKSALYTAVYVRLQDRGYPAKYDIEYVAGLPMISDGWWNGESGNA
jgi:hypothetical protein